MCIRDRPYGAFLQSVLEFIILALCVFCALKVINRFKRKKAEEVVDVYKRQVLGMTQVFTNEDVLLTPSI